MKKLSIVFVMMVVALSGCRTQYVPIETVIVEKSDSSDTVEVTDTFYKEKTVVIKEMDSMMAAEYGIKLALSQKAYLVLQKELERERSKDKKVEVKTIIKEKKVEVPVPVERELSRWESFCLEYGKVMVGATVVLVILVVWLILWLIRLRKRS